LPRRNSSYHQNSQDDPMKMLKIEFYKLLNVRDPEDGCSGFNVSKVNKMMDDLPQLCKDKYLFSAFNEPITALHMLCAVDAPLSSIRRCYKHNPNAVYDASSAMGSPLHYACWFNVSTKTIRYIASKDLESLQVKNRAKRTPLHLACLRQADQDLIILLTEACPEAAAMLDKDGMSPLHLACDTEKPRLAVIEDLTEVNPQVLETQAGTGSKTPLHLALERDAGLDILKDMILSNPKALKCQDASGNTPLHVACARSASYKELKVLLRKYPKSAQKLNFKGETPIAIAKAKQLGDDILKLLQPHSPLEEL
jgi:ankyrin repeat protein